MILNAEQLLIIYSDIESDLFIEALAGTGKTTVLIEFAKEHFNSNILYLVFSKNMRKHANKKFPVNTETHTVNSFVYRYIKDTFKKKIINDINTKFIISNIKEIGDIYKKDQLSAVKFSINILEVFNFIVNSNIDISSEAFEPHGSSYFYAKKLYLQMIEDNNMPITHSAMLRHFLDNFDFSKFNYEYVLIDEAQDINPPMINIINKINAKKIYVGDKKQGIFKFRNTINIFHSDVNTKKLTGSYRFGSNIAEFISKLTANVYNESDFCISGLSENPGYIIFDEEEIKSPYAAYITRTNAHLFDCAFEAAQQGKKVSIPFDWEEIKKLLLDIFYLKAGLYNSIKNPIIKEYSSYEELKQIHENGGDQEFIFLVKVLEKYGLELPEKIKILEHNLAGLKYADIIYITAHKAKGLEFYSVELGNDFKKFRHSTEIEEKNLIYVAMTRAMEVLKPNKDLIEQYSKTGGNIYDRFE